MTWINREIKDAPRARPSAANSHGTSVDELLARDSAKDGPQRPFLTLFILCAVVVFGVWIFNRPDQPQRPASASAASSNAEQAGFEYGFKLGRSVRGQIDQPKDWAMEPLAKLHLEKAIGVTDAVVWKEGFKRGYIAGLR